MNKETLRMQMLAGIITEGQYKDKLNENIENWGNEEDDYGNSEKNYRTKPSLADFDYDEEAYKKYMEENFPDEQVDIDESSRLYREGDNIFNIIDQEIIIPDQDSNYANGTTDDEDGTNLGIGFPTQKLGKDYTDEQKQNFIDYLKNKAEEGNENAKELYTIAQTSPESKEFI
jgi:hypothetical protein